jgi:hypothetical protein
VFLHDDFGSGLAENSGQLKNVVEPPVLKPLLGFMLRNIVLTNQQIHDILDSCHKLSLRFPFPDSGGDLRHQHHYHRQGRFFGLHPETKLFAKRPQAASKRFLDHIATPDERSRLSKSHKISVLRTVGRRNFHQIVQFRHFRAQWIGSCASKISCMLQRHPIVDPITIPVARSFIPHSGGKPRAIPKLGQM